MADKNYTAVPAQRHPNLVGAGVLAGAIAGATLGGVTGSFAAWLPLGAVAGLLFGLFLQHGESKAASK